MHNNSLTCTEIFLSKGPHFMARRWWEIITGANKVAIYVILFPTHSCVGCFIRNQDIWPHECQFAYWMKCNNERVHKQNYTFWITKLEELRSFDNKTRNLVRVSDNWNESQIRHDSTLKSPSGTRANWKEKKTKSILLNR